MTEIGGSVARSRSIKPVVCGDMASVYLLNGQTELDADRSEASVYYDAGPVGGESDTFSEASVYHEYPNTDTKAEEYRQALESVYFYDNNFVSQKYGVAYKPPPASAETAQKKLTNVEKKQLDPDDDAASFYVSAITTSASFGRGYGSEENFVAPSYHQPDFEHVDAVSRRFAQFDDSHSSQYRF
ncbi:unnamed protein product [Bursaphelenchus okinawaensis]|uniref:Uncharacterized protein n=1 Tax=Bursaphelenchus okinawaensis TaxID=465554 RepID=A0A811LKS2_9BILA|nr:unnamed protein product [Bursaphelenchus okinawaensis]CAG9125744.1 unnamed protein product [Bursaphelenchus okinawaensis]